MQSQSLLLLLLIFFAACTSKIANTSSNPTAPKSYVKEELSELAGYKYLEIVENQETLDPNLNMVIAMHWMGSTPRKFMKFLSDFNIPIRVLLVQAPYSYKEGYSFFEVEPTSYYDLGTKEKHAVIMKEAEKLSQFIEKATKKYKPSNKPIVMGASQGGDLSYILATKYSHLISASCPLLATLDEELMQAQLPIECTVPIQVFHGKEDAVVAIEEVRKQVQYLTTKNCTVTLNEYNDCGHQIPDTMQADYKQFITRIFNTK